MKDKQIISLLLIGMILIALLITGNSIRRSNEPIHNTNYSKTIEKSSKNNSEHIVLDKMRYMGKLKS